ncbi:hypothetical protein [Bacillus cereus group sp. BfR-BA-01355]|uniref:hypothetical protein n=1 Tax=Bacillus cereus group sp. BfR-BA-01355 TaxID=2920318 RepID=UPI001F5AAF61|nr:hypothetical protein [Bacillus cereus group sp. BfR-BA-01355]
MFRFGWEGFICSMFESRLDKVCDLHEITESTIFNEKKSFEEFLEKEASELDEESKQDFYEHYQDEYFKFRDDFPNISRSSLFMNCFFSLENFLYELCCHFDSNSERKLKDAKDRGLRKYKNYLKQFVSDKSFFATPLWESIMFYQELRNALAHADGNLDMSSNESLINKLEKEKNITLTKQGEIRLNEDFINEVSDKLKAFSNGLYKQLEPSIRKK